tara:strand:+ start:111 stop:953 length:843 start_codon:yes stop_codon:yes gene_type:complete
MKILISLIFSYLLALNANAESLSEKISNLIPGEGLTEASVQINEDDNPDIEILAVRDLSSDEYSNTFTQFSLHTQETNGHDRFIGNLGFGYRMLSDDKSNLFGVNVFFDNDFEAEHQRGSIGLEVKGAYLDLTVNSYYALTDSKNYKGTAEEVLSGQTINLASQIPYAPWANLNLQSYSWENVKASSDTEGYTVSIESYLTPSLALEVKNDYNDNAAVDDEFTYKLTYNYPPRGDGKSMQDGLSKLAFEKQNMEAKLKDKVKRDNNIVIEIQGSVIITSK